MTEYKILHNWNGFKAGDVIELDEDNESLMSEFDRAIKGGVAVANKKKRKKKEKVEEVEEVAADGDNFKS